MAHAELEGDLPSVAIAGDQRLAKTKSASEGRHVVCKQAIAEWRIWIDRPSMGAGVRRDDPIVFGKGREIRLPRVKSQAAAVKKE
jgi:hypothetical protein